jgi:hypothetical protein
LGTSIKVETEGRFFFGGWARECARSFKSRLKKFFAVAESRMKRRGVRKSDGSESWKIDAGGTRVR